MIKWLKEFWADNSTTIILALSAIVVFAFIIFSISVFGKINEKIDSKEYYSGCECGGKWIYDQAVGIHGGVRFMYECDKCGNVKIFVKKFNESEEEE